MRQQQLKNEGRPLLEQAALLQYYSITENSRDKCRMYAF